MVSLPASVLLLTTLASPFFAVDKVTLSKGSSFKFSFYKEADHSYIVCVAPTSTSDSHTLYGMYDTPPTSSTYHMKSSSSGTIEYNCIDFEATKDGMYYLKVYAKASTSFGVFICEDDVCETM